MTTMFFTSDLHLGHVRCATTFRSFASVEEHNELIVERWNSVVADDDIVYILGDLAMGTITDSLATAARLRGHKYLVPGNHDRMHPSYHNKGTTEQKRQKRLDWTNRYADEAGVVVMARQLTFTRPRGPELVEILACHFPFEDDHEEYADEPRFPEYRPDPETTPYLLHGHIHDLRRESDDRRQVNVGVDVWDFTPVRWETLLEVMGL